MDIQTQRILFGAAGSGSEVDPGYAIEHTTNAIDHAVEPYINGGKDVAVFLSYGNQLAKFDADGIVDWNVLVSTGTDQTTLAVDDSGAYVFYPSGRDLIAVSQTGTKRWTADYNASAGGGESFNSRGAMCHTPGYVGMVMAGFPGPFAGQSGSQYAIPWFASAYASNGSPVFNLAGSTAGTRAWYLRNNSEDNNTGEARYIRVKPDPSSPAGLCTVYNSYETGRISFWRWTTYLTSFSQSGRWRGQASSLSNLELATDPSGNAYITDTVYGGTYYNARIVKFNTSNNVVWNLDLYASTSNVWVLDIAADDEAVYAVIRGLTKNIKLVKFDASTGAEIYEINIYANFNNMNGYSKSYISLGVDHVYITLPYAGFIKLPKDGSTIGSWGVVTLSNTNEINSNISAGVSWSAQSQLTMSAPYYGPQDANNPQYGDEYYNCLLKPNSDTINPVTNFFNSKLSFE